MRKRKPKTKVASPEVSLAPVAKELELAYRRIDGAPARRLKWLLSFSELPLDNLSEGHLANLRWEVVVFGLNKKPDEMKEDSLGEFHTLVDLHTILGQGLAQMMTEPQKGAPLSLVKDFQETMRKAFDDLFKPGPWPVRRPSAVERIALREHPLTDVPIHENASPELSGHDILLTQAIDLIKAEKDRLKICHNLKCSKRFVAAKKGRAFFHSPKCSTYVRVNKMRGNL